MRYAAATCDRDWKLFEIERQKRRPCSDAYADDANEAELQNILSQLALLRAAGCPADTERGMPNYQRVGKYKPQGAPEPLTVHVLKAKPSRWRLYYYVRDPQARQIVFLYAVSKKTDKRDPQDFERCKKLLDGIYSGQYRLIRIYVPPR